MQLRMRTVALLVVPPRDLRIVPPRDCEDPEVLGHTILDLVGLQSAGATNAETGCATTSSAPNSAHATIALLSSGGSGCGAGGCRAVVAGSLAGNIPEAKALLLYKNSFEILRLVSTEGSIPSAERPRSRLVQLGYTHRFEFIKVGRC